MATAIDVSHLTKRYDTVTALDDVTFDVGVLGGKFLSEPDGYGAAMAVFRLWFKIL